MKAFPSRESIYGSDVIGVKENSGMDLRDYFAGLAMQELLNHIKGIYEPTPMQQLVNLSYKVADAMMEAREK